MAMNVTWDNIKKIWSGSPLRSIYSNEASVGQIVFNTMRNYPKNVCQISDSDGIVVTNEMAITWSVRLAQHLKRRGLNHKSAVGIVAKNTTYVMPLGVACLFNTTPFHAVSPMFDEASVKQIYEITKPAIIFCDGDVYDKVREATKGWSPEIIIISQPVEGVLGIETLLKPTANELPVMLYQPEPLKEGSEQTAAIITSSGTSGLPKAGCISQSVLLQDDLQIDGETIYFLNSGLDWISGLIAFMFSALNGSTRILTDKPYTPENFVQLVEKHKINYAVLAPVQLAALADYKEASPEALSSIKNLMYGGGALSQAVFDRSKELFKGAKLNGGYGMTECGMISFNFGATNAASVGRLFPGIRSRIVDESGKNLSHNEVGEILVYAERYWNGYYGNPMATQKMRDSNGWFHTGDLGYFDDNNYLYIVDRIRETLKYKSIHYWPTEIENTIQELPQVRAACVVGVSDELQGDAAGALVLLNPGSKISAKEIIDHVAKRFALSAKHLHAGVRFTDKLPFNSNGKYMRKVALEMFRALN